MKRIFLAVTAVAGMLSLTGCEYLEELLQLADDIEKVISETYVDPWSNLVNETSYEAVVDGNTLTYGNHTYTIVNEIDVTTTEHLRGTASVSFTNIPSGYTEFSAVYENLLGNSIAGTAAMIPMAMEIYARDAATGEKCIKLLCTAGAAGEMITEVNRKIIPSGKSPDNDRYIQRYIPAALLKDATPSNAYSPATPYTVMMTMTSNGVKPNNLEGGDVIYMSIVTSSWSTAQRGVDIFQATGSTRYKVFGCPGCYSTCPEIVGKWAGLK